MVDELASHKLQLVKELLEDIELSRLQSDQLLMKASRLARLVENNKIYEWLQFELSGYRANKPLAIEYMDAFGRWGDKEKGMGYWQSLVEIESTIETMKSDLDSLSLPNINYSPSSSNPNEFIGLSGSIAQSIQNILLRKTNAISTISKLTGIRMKTIAYLHDFITQTYYEMCFSHIACTIFEEHKTKVDELLSLIATEAFRKIPSIYERLSTGDEEAISHALNTCRRLINAFGDAVLPPSEGTISINGDEYKIGTEQYLNRITVFLYQNCQSQSRRERLRKSLRLIHERLSAGVHADVDSQEARSLFLHTYLVLGEILIATQVSTGLSS